MKNPGRGPAACVLLHLVLTGSARFSHINQGVKAAAPICDYVCDRLLNACRNDFFAQDGVRAFAYVKVTPSAASSTLRADELFLHLPLTPLPSSLARLLAALFRVF